MQLEYIRIVLFKCNNYYTWVIIKLKSTSVKFTFETINWTFLDCMQKLMHSNCSQMVGNTSCNLYQWCEICLRLNHCLTLCPSKNLSDMKVIYQSSTIMICFMLGMKYSTQSTYHPNTFISLLQFCDCTCKHTENYFMVSVGIDWFLFTLLTALNLHMGTSVVLVRHLSFSFSFSYWCRWNKLLVLVIDVDGKNF